MENIKITQKRLLLIGSMVYVCLAVFAAIFYKERTIFTDIAFHLFEMTREGNFAIQNYRFGAVFTQFFPLMAIKAGLSLNALLLIYSEVFIFYYYSIFFINTVLFKQAKWGLAMLLFSTLMVTDTFYWIQSEFPQGLGFMLLYFGYVQYADKHKQNIILYYLINIAALVTLVFFHPLLIFPFTFVIAYLFGKNHLSRVKLAINGLLYLILYGIKSKLFKTGYDSNAMEGLDNFKHLFPNYINLQSNKDFIELAFFNYYFLLIGALASFIYLASTRKWLRLGLLLLGFSGYLLLINVTYHKGATPFYMENLYLPLSLMVIIPLVFDLIKHVSLKYLTLFLSIFLVIRLGHIYLNHADYTDRLNWERELLTKTKNYESKKIVVPESTIPLDTLMMTWATSYEFWILSTVETGESRSILIHQDPASLRQALPKKTSFLTAWGTFPYNTLNPLYFKFKDSSNYVIMDTEIR